MEDLSAVAAASAAVAAAALEDDEHDSKENVLLRCFLQEWQLLKRLLNQIVSNGGASQPSDVNKIRSIVSLQILFRTPLLLKQGFYQQKFRSLRMICKPLKLGYFFHR